MSCSFVSLCCFCYCVFFSSRRRHTRCALVTGVQTCALPIVETPARVARAWREWFAGYAIDPAALLARTFTESAGYEDTITLRSIPVVSTCEDHLAQTTGVAHVAYRPGASVVGISKLSRLSAAYAPRRQMQDRLTSHVRL